VTPVVSTRRGAGPAGSDRVTVVLPHGTALGTWLRITTLPNARTTLTQADTFYFANLPGDTANTSAQPIVNVTNLARTRANAGRTSAAALAASHFDRDGQVDGLDVSSPGRTSVGRSRYSRSPPEQQPRAPRPTSRRR
jgi:hypothetical protein